MAFYLIDYENIKNISGCDTLTERDTVIFFYSQNANSLSFDLHVELGQTPAKKEYFLSQCGGKNALDFQLSSYVGYLLAKFPDEKITIVSKDKGYECLLAFWSARGSDRVEIRKNILSDTPEEASTLSESSAEQSPAPTAQEDNVALSAVLEKQTKNLGLSEAQLDEVESIVNTYKTKQAINNNLMKLLRDSDKVGRINKLIKPFLKKKK